MRGEERRGEQLQLLPEMRYRRKITKDKILHWRRPRRKDEPVAHLTQRRSQQHQFRPPSVSPPSCLPFLVQKMR